MRRIRVSAVVAALVGALAVINAAGAGSGSAATGKLDLSTPEAIDAYLLSKGVDPATVVRQTGLLNYAGPECPSPEWNCTTATAVVQIAKAGGENRSECRARPEPTQFEAEERECLIVQAAPPEEEERPVQNHAWCKQHVTDDPAVVLDCHITQTNTTGGNHAYVDQDIDQTFGPAQTATDKASVTQVNGIGNNHVLLSQDISQFTSDVPALPAVVIGPPQQSQSATFEAVIQQHTGEEGTIGTAGNGETGGGAGNNHCVLNQSLKQDGRAQGAVNQNQFGEQDGDVVQDATPEGDDVTPSGLTSEDGAGSSHCTAHQHERKVLIGDALQTQIGPQDCCAEQTGGGNSSVNIHQDSFAKASQETAVQNLDTHGHFSTPGHGVIVHHLKIDEDQITAQESGTGFQKLDSSCTSTEAVEEPEYEEAGCFSDDGDAVPSFDFFAHAVTAHDW